MGRFGTDTPLDFMQRFVDSDAVIADIQDLNSVNDVENSNIFQATTDNQIQKSVFDYIKQIKCMSNLY